MNRNGVTMVRHTIRQSTFFKQGLSLSAFLTNYSLISQRSLAEKAELTKRLEDIEGSLLEREATFDQLQRQHAAAEASVAAGMQRAEAERKRIAALTQKTQDLERERTQLQTTCEQNQNAIKVIA